MTRFHLNDAKLLGLLMRRVAMLDVDCSLWDHERHPLLLPSPSGVRGLPPPSQYLTSNASLSKRDCFGFTYLCFRWTVRAHKAPLDLLVWFSFGFISIRLYFPF